MACTKPLKILLVENVPIALHVHHKLLGDLSYFPDGTEVAAHIRHRESHSHRAHIVGLTTLCTPDVTADCLAAGMDIVMTKPLTIHKLLRLLAAAMQITSQQNEPLTQEIT